jgi:hypothetical protein
LPAAELARFTAALSLFTDQAFVFWLPAFMLAALENDNGFSANIADAVARKFVRRGDGGERTKLLSDQQIHVVANFFDECARRYPDPYREGFAPAALRLRRRIG